LAINGFGDLDEIEKIQNDPRARSSADVKYYSPNMYDGEAIAKMMAEIKPQLVNIAGIQHVTPIADVAETTAYLHLTAAKGITGSNISINGGWAAK